MFVGVTPVKEEWWQAVNSLAKILGLE